MQIKVKMGMDTNTYLLGSLVMIKQLYVVEMSNIIQLLLLMDHNI
nr:MAG TPA: hypothetical protein [Bacteriophage sp.]